MVAPGLILSLRKDATELRRNTQHAEIIRRDGRGADRLCRTLRGQIDRAKFVGRRHSGKRPAGVAPSEVIRYGDSGSVGLKTFAGVYRSDDGDALWFINQGTGQHESADHTEHGGIDGDSESDGGDSDAGEGRRFAQLPAGKAAV